jgi:hypothetical protein
VSQRWAGAAAWAPARLLMLCCALLRFEANNPSLVHPQSSCMSYLRLLFPSSSHSHLTSILPVVPCARSPPRPSPSHLPHLPHLQSSPMRWPM